MKKILQLSLFLVIFSASSNAQCDLKNAGFENWTLQPLAIETADGEIIENGILIPDDNFMFFRFIIQNLGIAFGDTNAIIQFKENPQGFAGIDRSDESSEGVHSLKVFADLSLNFSDVVNYAACDELPASISIDLGHSGTSADSFQVLAVWDEGSNFGIDEENLPISVATQMIGMEGDKTFTTYTIPFEHLSFETGDTMTLTLTASFNDPENGYFLVDNIRYNATAAAHDVVKAKITVGPNPTRGALDITSDIQNGSQLTVYDMVGNLITRKEFNESTTLDLSGKNSGMYLVQISDRKGNLVETKKVLLNN